MYEQEAAEAPAEAGEAGAPRVGDRVTLSARVVGSIPDGSAATVRVYDRGRGDGQKLLDTLQGRVQDRRVQVPWTVKGRPGYRAHELQLEFEVEAGGKRTPRTRLPLQPERLVEVEIAAGQGALELDAAVPFYVFPSGEARDRPTFASAQRFRAELPRDYRGPLVVRRNGRRVLTVEVGKLPLNAAEPVRIKSSAVASSGPVAGIGEPVVPLPSAAVSDATRVNSRTALGNNSTGETVFIHTLHGSVPLPNGAHDTTSLEGHLVRWFVEAVFGSALPPTMVSIVQNETILREFGTRFYIKDHKYIIFRGSPTIRRHLTGTRYRVDHPKVLVLTGGGRLGAARGLADATRQSWVGLVIVGGLDVVEGIQSGSSWSEILVDVASDTAKGLLGTAITLGVIAGSVALLSGMALTVPVGLVVVGGLVLGVVIGKRLDKLDAKLGATEELRRQAPRAERALSDAGHWLAEQFDRFVVDPWQEFEADVGRRVGTLERDILNLYLSPHGARP